MGGFYTNYTLRGPSAESVAKQLSGRNAVVATYEGGYVVVFDEQSDNQDQSGISGLASSLSSQLNCVVLAVINHDDDILWYQLYESGNVVDEYDSTPGYFDATEPMDPAGGDATKLCRAFGSSAVAEVEAILRKSFYAEDGFVFATERHLKLVETLGLPALAAGAAYGSFEDPAFVEDMDAPDILYVGKNIR